jgi:chromate transporter
MPAPLPAASSPPRNPPTLIELFAAFAVIALCGFGGVLYWSRRMLVEVRGWMSPEEFNEAYALCQFLPGPNIVNLSVVFGSRIRGVTGSLIALLGLIGPPVVIVMALAFLYAQFGELELVRRALLGVAAAAAGLVLATAAKMGEPLARSGSMAALAVAAATFIAIGVLRGPLLWVLAVLLPASIALAWWTRR